MAFPYFAALQDGQVAWSEHDGEGQVQVFSAPPEHAIAKLNLVCSGDRLYVRPIDLPTFKAMGYTGRISPFVMNEQVGMRFGFIGGCDEKAAYRAATAVAEMEERTPAEKVVARALGFYAVVADFNGLKLGSRRDGRRLGRIVIQAARRRWWPRREPAASWVRPGA